jgi:hypothetical protein
MQYRGRSIEPRQHGGPTTSGAPILGRHTEALAATAEAVQARRSWPATAAASLAFTLWTYAEVRLAARDELPQAISATTEAATIYRTLAATGPAAYHDELRQVLAMSDDLAATTHASRPGD